MDHEQAFVETFIVKPKRTRYLEKLASDKHRRKFLSRLHHNLDYVSELATQIPPGEQTVDLIQAKLRSLGAPDECHVITAGADLDGRQLLLQEALNCFVGMGDGVVLSCIPGRLAYYESEEPNGRFILTSDGAA